MRIFWATSLLAGVASLTGCVGAAVRPYSYEPVSCADLIAGQPNSGEMPARDDSKMQAVSSSQTAKAVPPNAPTRCFIVVPRPYFRGTPAYYYWQTYDGEIAPVDATYWWGPPPWPGGRGNGGGGFPGGNYGGGGHGHPGGGHNGGHGGAGGFGGGGHGGGGGFGH
jgi:hypothetical protein